VLNFELLTAMTEISDLMIVKATGEYDCEIVVRLSLDCRSLNRISGLERCTALEVLNLSGNVISAIEGLESLENLKRLDLSYNRIKTIGDGLARSHKLEYLSLAGNSISSLAEVEALSTLPALTSLILQSPQEPQSERNPVCADPSYNATVRRALPRLNTLDCGSALVLDMVLDMGERIEDLAARAKQSSEVGADDPGQDEVNPASLESWMVGVGGLGEEAQGKAATDKASAVVGEILSQECNTLLRKASTVAAQKQVN
jgi:hypothetical protein